MPIPNIASRTLANIQRLYANGADVVGADGVAKKMRKGADNISNPRVDMYGTPRGVTPTAPFSVVTAGTGVPQEELDTIGGGGGFRSGGGGGAVDKDAALRNTLKSRIGGRGADVDAIYQALFGDLEGLLRARDAELEDQYGSQLKKATETYTDALPTIENSYAAIGSSDSTDQADAKTKADKGFKETTATIGQNKAKDKAALGQYGNENRAKFTADRDAAKRAIDSSRDTTDVDALRGLDNDLAGNLSQAGVTRATLGTDGAARKSITDLTGDNGRYDAAVNALDSVIKSSMSGAVKSAAVKAITDAGGLSEDEKKKVQQTYGNVYAEQAAL